MSETDNDQRHTPLLRRVRCGYCRLPLVQIYQGNLLYTLQRNGEDIVSQPLPVYSYRLLTDSAPLLFCPQCHTALSSETVTIVLSRTVAIEEGKVPPCTGNF